MTKIMQWTRLVAVCVAAVAVSAKSAQAGMMYGSTLQDDSNPATSTADNYTALITVDTATAGFTHIGSSSWNPRGSLAQNLIHGLAFDSNGKLFGTPLFDSKLLSLDRNTGAATVVADIKDSAGAFHVITSLAFDSATNTMYGFDGSVYTGGPYQLATIDTTTGVVTDIGTPGSLSNMAGLAFALMGRCIRWKAYQAADTIW